MSHSTTTLLTILSNYYNLVLTPSLTLSLLLATEHSSILNSIITFITSFLHKPTTLNKTLQNELDQRILPFKPQGHAEGDRVISANTLRVVDAALWKLRLKSGSGSTSASGSGLDDLVREHWLDTLAREESILPASPSYLLLRESLPRVLDTYAITNAVQTRSNVAYDPHADPGQRTALVALWTLYKPDRDLPAVEGKHWQEIGFQGSNPATDFRALGLLALDSLTHFATSYPDRAVVVCEEAVEGGPNWYPFALMVIHMARFALDMAAQRDLQLLLLRSFQVPPTPTNVVLTNPTTTTTSSSSNNPSSGAEEDREREEEDTPNVDTTPFLRIVSELVLLFHANWLKGRFTVMQFEHVEKDFKKALVPWVRRGVIDGRALGWLRSELKLD
ncbi:hypothetical protein T439DRAFT_326084 [Meredithblackwellia eburnea MCA 4105]